MERRGVETQAGAARHEPVQPRALAATDLLDLLGIEISPARLKCAMLSFDSLQHLLTETGVNPLAKDAG